MLEILPTPTVSDEKHKSATNRASLLIGWGTTWRGVFQPLKRMIVCETRLSFMKSRAPIGEMFATKTVSGITIRQTILLYPMLDQPRTQKNSMIQCSLPNALGPDPSQMAL